MNKINSLLPNAIAEPEQVEPTYATPPDVDLVDAINKAFTVFQFAYHNQFHKAFATADDLAIAKRVWKAALAKYPPKVITAAAVRVVRDSKYLPSIASMTEACDKGGELLGLPDARSAFEEASRASGSKESYNWSHPVVYHAGRLAGWSLLRNEAEQKAWPVFEHHYSRLCRDVVQGRELSVDAPPPLPEKISDPLPPGELSRRLKELNKSIGKAEDSKGRAGAAKQRAAKPEYSDEFHRLNALLPNS